MTRPQSTLRLARPLLGFLLCLGLVGSAAAEDEPKTKWDAPAATKLANSLEETLDALYEQSLEAPVQPTAFQQRERDAAQGHIKRARDLGADYAQRMRTGWTRDDSEPFFRNVVEAVDQIFETAGDAVPSASAQPRINWMRSLLDQLNTLYEES